MAQTPQRDQFKLREQDLVQNTVEFPRRFPMAFDPQNRYASTGKDARMVNCYVETDKRTGEIWIYGRPGITVNTTKTGTGRGLYNWLGNVYAIFGDKIYKNGTDMGATLDTTNGVYRFEPFLAPSRLIFGNGVEAYYTDGTTVTNISDADFPSAFVKGWANLDQTLYVGVAASATIQGSDDGDPTAWDALNTITAYIEPDQLVALTKQLVYVLALKQWSIEAFYDAGNATGSPLGRVQGAKINWGAISADAIQEIDGVLFLPATNKKGNQSSGDVRVITITSLKDEDVSTPPVQRLMDGADFTACFSFSIHIMGHRFYVLTLKNSNLTLAYDFDEKRWAQWTDTNGNYFPFVAATLGQNGEHLLQHETDGKLYEMDVDAVTDNGSLFSVEIYTPNFDGGVRRNKMLSRLEFIGDQTAGSLLEIRCNDFDYAPTRWTQFRRVDLSKQRPYIDDCGTFVRRVYHFRHRCNAKFRQQGPEMQLAIGTL